VTPPIGRDYTAKRILRGLAAWRLPGFPRFWGTVRKSREASKPQRLSGDTTDRRGLHGGAHSSRLGGLAASGTSPLLGDGQEKPRSRKAAKVERRHHRSAGTTRWSAFFAAWRLGGFLVFPAFWGRSGKAAKVERRHHRSAGTTRWSAFFAAWRLGGFLVFPAFWGRSGKAAKPQSRKG
jgi:hypothetical protein